MVNPYPRLCAVSFKECWQDSDGRWYSSGGFPLQMAAIGSLFASMTLLITRSDRPGEGGLALPAAARIVALRKPEGTDLRRKLSILRLLPYYVSTIATSFRDADCVHVPLPGDIPLIGAAIAVAMKRPLIARYCGSWAATASTTIMNRVTRLFMRAFSGGRNVMLATGESERPPADGIRWIFATSLSDEELARITAATQRGLSDPPRLAYVGRLSAEKGVANLLKALAELEREGLRPAPRLQLIGDGPDRAELEALASRLGLSERVHFSGQLDRKALSAALAASDLCVQPSLTEGYSKAWLDAFAHGLPVVASEAGAARAVVGTERGWLVPPGDVARLAAAIREAVAVPRDWPALRRRCRAFAEGRTLEAWSAEIGRLCSERWKAPLPAERRIA
ncbi:MAG: glycosyltransferase [Acidobacteriota bacterium]